MKALFHLAAFGLYAWTCYEDFHIVSANLLPIPNQFFSKFVWLTLIDLYSQLIYHFIGVVLSLFSNRRHPIFDYVARAIIGPIGVSVTVLFWVLYWIDPGTLAHDEMGRKILAMRWFNHGLHTLPIITAHLDLLFWKHTNFSKTAILKGIAIFITLYLIDIHYVYYSVGFWAYPILGELPPPLRALFIVVCTFVVFLSYLWLSFVNSLVNGDKKKTKSN